MKGLKCICFYLFVSYGELENINLKPRFVLLRHIDFVLDAKFFKINTHIQCGPKASADRLFIYFFYWKHLSFTKGLKIKIGPSNFNCPKGRFTKNADWRATYTFYATLSVSFNRYTKNAFILLFLFVIKYKFSKKIVRNLRMFVFTNQCKNCSFNIYC